MKKTVVLALSTTAIILFSGCSAKGPQFTNFQQPEKGQSNVYLYRTSYFGGAIQPNIHKENISTKTDTIIGSIKPYGYIMTKVQPGKYQFWAKTEARNEVNLDIEPNKIYCIKHYITPGFFIGHPQFKIVDMAKCKKELKKTKLSLNKKRKKV